MIFGMEMSALFRALADDSRLRIMLLLQVMELSVGELALVLGQSQPRVSRHVRILAEAGLAERHKEGSWVFLRPALPRYGTEAAHLLDRLLRQPDIIGRNLSAKNTRDIQRLVEIRAQREERATEFFASHAAQWDAIRSLHLPETEIETTLKSVLGRESLGKMLDIGTGTGRIAELFAPNADHCIALDMSPEMLRLARAKLQHMPPDRIALVQGDFYALPLDDETFDTIILHQVLHYAHNPQAVIAEAGRVSGPGGRLIIVDFAPHGLEELRERDAHARLGFSDEQMSVYFAESHFALEQSETLSGGALTVKIWLGRRKPGLPKTDKPGSDTADPPSSSQKEAA